MRLLSSVVLLTGALSVGAYAYLPVVSFNHDNLANIVRIQQPAGRVATPVEAEPVQEQQAAENAGSPAVQRSFSPSLPLFVSALADRTRASREQQVAAPGTNAWRAVVVTDTARPAQSAAGDYAASVELARELQRELKRVGCYEGDIDGDWRGASRRSMSAFLTKVNATLPIDRPDYILLTLLQGHADRACGAACAAGQAVSSDGRCIPNVIVAQSSATDIKAESSTGQIAAASSGDVTSDSASAAVAATVAAAPVVAATAKPAVRLARDTKKPAPPAAAVTASPTSSTVAAAAPRAAIAGDLDAPSAQAAADTLVRREPLPGRMAIGAPVAPLASANAGTITGSITPDAPPANARPSPLAGLPRHVRATIDGTATPADAEPVAKAAAVPHIRPVESQQRARPAYAAPAREPSHARAPRYDRGYSSAPMVRTSQGKVRRGSPQHNLMLSLGGVF